MATLTGRVRLALAVVSVVGIAGLLSIEAADRLTREPAPWIQVRWQDDLSAERQTALERRYRLVSRRGPAADAPRSFGYLLLDTRRSNVEALVGDPAVADTNDVDREAFAVRPTADRGGTMSMVDRLPVLRDEGGRRIISGALGVMALAVVPVLLLAAGRTIARLAAHPDTRGGLRRVGRWLAEPPGRTAESSSNADPLAVAWKIAGGVLIVAIIGVPLLRAWEAVLFAAAAIVLVCSTRHVQWWRLGAAVAVAGAVLAVKGALPRADIAEAHNAFMVIGNGGPLERGLPPPVFRSWKAQFDALYPADPVLDAEPYSWRTRPVENTPIALYTQSADAIWRRPKYTRQVDVIDFHNLADFRGGFVNEAEKYNFWTGRLRRESMPFYVMYELSPASVGSRLQWKGQVFWERSDSGFDEINHPQVAARTIAAADAGRRVYAAFFPARESELHFSLAPTASLRVAAWINVLASVIGALAVLLLLLRPRREAAVLALLLFAAGYVALGLHIPAFGSLYWPHGGGNDGMVHDGYGRMMAMLAGNGQVVEALRGGESVYWFTPGTRYFRMVEKLIFGDTNQLYALAFACLPVVIFALLARFVRRGVALGVTALFLIVPIGSLTLVQYLLWARLGFGEPLGAGLFFLAVVLLLLTEPRWGGAPRGGTMAAAAVAGAALAASMFIRPNFAIAVVWVGVAYLWMAFRSRGFARGAVFACGLGLALWMPFHNWYYGNELYLISKSGATLSVPLGVRDYVTAAGDMVRGASDTTAVKATSTQLRGWLAAPVFDTGKLLWLAGPAHVLNLVALALCGWVGLTWIRAGGERSALAVVAIAALCHHLPMLFIYDTNPRYAMVGWDLGLIVFIVWVAHQVSELAGAKRRSASMAMTAEMSPR